MNAPTEQSVLAGFHTPRGRESVTARLREILAGGTEGIRAAVCFFRQPGVKLLKEHKALLQHASSFVVVSIDQPTDLRAVLVLHDLMPGKVYLHLGSITPEERGVGRGLMHSKVVMAQSGTGDTTAWVGSHNFTASALEGGNYEAAVDITQESDSPMMQDIYRHLCVCRDSAERFDPNAMDRYERIQRSREKARLDHDCRTLIIHAEESERRPSDSFAAEVALEFVELDRYLRADMDVRLFLYRPGALKVGSNFDTSMATVLGGQLTSFGHTEKHRDNRGVRGEFSGAERWIGARETHDVLRLEAHRVSPEWAVSQLVFRIDGLAVDGKRVYSLAGSMTGRLEAVAGEPIELSALDPEYASFFTRESVEGELLIHRPLKDRTARLRVEAFPETLPGEDTIQIKGTEVRGRSLCRPRRRSRNLVWDRSSMLCVASSRSRAGTSRLVELSPAP